MTIKYKQLHPCFLKLKITGRLAQDNSPREALPSPKGDQLLGKENRYGEDWEGRLGEYSAWEGKAKVLFSFLKKRRISVEENVAFK